MLSQNVIYLFIIGICRGISQKESYKLKLKYETTIVCRYFTLIFNAYNKIMIFIFDVKTLP